MSPRRRILSAMGIAALCALACGAAAPKTGPATVTGFQHAGGFSAEGWKGWDISGKEAQMASADAKEINIKELRVRLFSGQADLAVETTIESPQATVLPREDLARSDGFLLINGASYQATGDDWVWNGTTHVIRVNRNVVVKFSPEAAAGRKPAAAAGKPPQPITIESNSLVINQDPQQNEGRNQFVFTGNVSVTDGNSTTRCRELEVLAARDKIPEAGPAAPGKNSANVPTGLGVGGIEQIHARGKVITRQGDVEARGEQVELVPGSQNVVVTGQPQVRDISSDSLVEGSRITWDRDNDTVKVDPLPATADSPPLVRVSMPPLARQQKSAATAAGLPADSRLVITGQSLRGDFGKSPRSFDLEGSVAVKDPQLTVFAQRLNAEFDPPAQAPNRGPAGLNTSPNTEVGHLRHLTTSGNVQIFQNNRITIAQQAEIFPPEGDPPKGRIVLSGNPRIEDSYGNITTVRGSRILLFTDESQAFVEGVPGRPAEVVMESLPDLGEGLSVREKTDITSKSLTMQRDQDPTFSFAGDVHVQAGNLSVDCGNIEIVTRNPKDAAGDALEDIGKIGNITGLVARNQVVVKQGDYEAHAARAEIFPRVNVSDNATTADAKTKPYRFIELFGDPDGVAGPRRPTVVLPLGDLGLASGSMSANETARSDAGAPATITSDEQKLLTSPAGNIYMFSGNVQITGKNFDASCDEVLVKANPGGGNQTQNAIEKITATGNVRIAQVDPVSQRQRVVTGGLAEISPKDGKLVLSDKPVVVNLDGTRSEALGSIELSRDPAMGYTSTIIGQPGKRPSFTLPKNSKTFDNLLKPANKPPSGNAP